jgi:hypothetical protein
MSCCTGSGFGKLALGVAVAAAAAFGSYNYLTTGCPLGTKKADTAGTTLVAAADTGEAKSCCPLSGAETLAAAAPAAAVVPVAAEATAKACCGAGCAGDKAKCPTGEANCADSVTTMVAAEAEGCVSEVKAACGDKAAEACADEAAAGCADKPACHDELQADADAPAPAASNG